MFGEPTTTILKPITAKPAVLSKMDGLAVPFVVGSVSTVTVKEFCAVALRQIPANKKALYGGITAGEIEYNTGSGKKILHPKHN
jgi:hypothetical protein